MSFVKITHKNSNYVICEKAKIANSLIDRVIGLMFKSNIKNTNGDGLLIDPCNSIHTFFMRFNLNVIFISKDNRVVKIIKNLKPWRITLIYFGAKKVLELSADSLQKIDLKKGDELTEEPCIN
ncbi:MAG: DUF192 domain-containing protein [Bacteriovoracaceae bacterium]